MGALVLAAGLALLARLQVVAMAALCSFQAFLLACVAGWQAWSQADPTLLWSAPVVLLLHGAALPAGLVRLQRKTKEPDAPAGPRLLLACTATVVLAAVAGATITRQPMLAFAPSVLLTGLCALIGRRGVLARQAGLLVMLNGAGLVVIAARLPEAPWLLAASATVPLPWMLSPTRRGVGPCAAGLAAALLGVALLAWPRESEDLAVAAGMLAVLGMATVAGIAAVQPGLLAAPAVALVLLMMLRLAPAPDAAILGPGILLVALGLVGVAAGAVGVWRARGQPRAVAMATLLHAGVACAAFGLGSDAAIRAGLLHVLALVLARTAIELCGRSPARALALARDAGLLALAATPPWSGYSSLFMILRQAAGLSPAMAMLLGFGATAGAVSLLRRLARRPRRPGHPTSALRMVPACALLVALAVLGLAMP